MFDKLLDYFIGFMMVASVLGVVTVFISVGMTATSEHYSLPKNEWQCVEWKTTHIYHLVGKVMVPTENKECVVYRQTT